eukprot:scaffold104113_cov15-Tisochrysis_lutea.AAC.1
MLQAGKGGVDVKGGAAGGTQQAGKGVSERVEQEAELSKEEQEEWDRIVAQEEAERYPRLQMEDQAAVCDGARDLTARVEKREKDTEVLGAAEREERAREAARERREELELEAWETRWECTREEEDFERWDRSIWDTQDDDDEEPFDDDDEEE